MRPDKFYSLKNLCAKFKYSAKKFSLWVLAVTWKILYFCISNCISKNWILRSIYHLNTLYHLLILFLSHIRTDKILQALYAIINKSPPHSDKFLQALHVIINESPPYSDKFLLLYTLLSNFTHSLIKFLYALHVVISESPASHDKFL